MGVYLYPSGTQTELKNAYIGDYRWQPWANTLLWLPLNSTDLLADKSWNNRDTSTNSGMTLSTQQWVSCYKVWTTWGINLGTSAVSRIRPSTNEFTFNLRIYVDNTTSPNRCYFEWAIYNQYRLYLGREYNTKKPRFLVKKNNSDVMTVMNNAAWNNKWSLITFTINNWTVNFYIDWVLDSHFPITWVDNNWFGTWTSTSEQWIWLFNIRDWLSSWSAANCYVSNCIMEDKSRTAQEISDYFNTIKADYWL